MTGPLIHGTIGAYGKMPSQGDFIRIAPPAGFVRNWDAWLQRTLPSARQMLGGRWQECYFSAPIWRFSLAPGVVTNGAVTGLMMPSVDRVGRAFPLTLVASTAPQCATAEAHLAQGPFFGALEEIALEALEDAMTPARLERELGSLLAAFRSGALAANTDAGQVAIITRGTASQCQWSCLLGEGAVHLKTAALPDPAMLARMFDPAAGYWHAEAAE